MMTGTETMNQHTILATRLGDLTVVRNAEAVVGLYFPHHWYMPGPDAMVAQLTGRPRAVRAVGTACATNPLPVVVPCHRVVRSDGAMGGYLGGVGAKRTLLALEAAA